LYQFNKSMIHSIGAKIAAKWDPLIDLLYMEYPNTRTLIDLFLCSALRTTNEHKNIIDIILPPSLKTLRSNKIQSDTHLSEEEVPEESTLQHIIEGDTTGEIHKSLHVISSVISYLPPLYTHPFLGSEEDTETLLSIYEHAVLLPQNVMEQLLQKMFNSQLRQHFVKFLTLCWTHQGDWFDTS